MSERVHSVEGLRVEIAAVLREYMQHIEPSATVDVTALRCEAIGENISLFIDLPAAGGSPYVQVTLSRLDEDSQPVEPSRGRTLFNR